MIDIRIADILQCGADTIVMSQTRRYLPVAASPEHSTRQQGPNWRHIRDILGPFFREMRS